MVGRRSGFLGPCWRGPTVIYGFAGGAAPTWSAAGRNLGRPVGVARRWYMALSAGRRQHDRPAGGFWGALLAWPDGDISVYRRDSANRSRRWHAPARNFCEDFAPRNEAARLCGGRGANRAAEKVAGGRWRRGISVKILLPGTKPQGFAGSGEQIAPLKCRPAGMRRRRISVKILLPETKPQGFAGDGEQIAPLKRPPEADGGAEFL